MSVVLCTLAINEMEWFPLLYQQHKDWPTLKAWVIVEAADRTYAQTNPGMVSAEGLSVDGTSEFLRDLATKDKRVIYIPHGFTEHQDPALAKCAARQRYLDACEEIQPDRLWVLDADEFYTRDDQREIVEMMQEDWWYDAWIFPFVHVWRPAAYAGQPLFQWEVVRGFWGMSHCRGYKWYSGMRYADDHNCPSANVKGVWKDLHENVTNYGAQRGMPACVHMGHAAQAKTRLAKNAYYVARGEGVNDKRAWYVKSRAAYETWTPGMKLPRRAKVIPYTGPVPECWPCRKSINGQHYDETNCNDLGRQGVCLFCKEKLQ